MAPNHAHGSHIKALLLNQNHHETGSHHAVNKHQPRAHNTVQEKLFAPDFDSEQVFKRVKVDKRVQRTVNGKTSITWSPRIMVITDGRVAFLMEDSAEIRDEIGLLDIDVIEEMDGDDTLTGGLGRQNSRTKRTTVMRKNKETGKLLEHQHSTIRLGGHNEGSHEGSSFRLYSATHNRNFFLRCKTPELRKAAMDQIEAAQEAAIAKRAEEFALSRVEIARVYLRAKLESDWIQRTIGIMLFTNFAINIAEAELNNQESAKDLLVVLDYVDLAFTFFYCIELGCNLFVHWWKEFVTDGWSMFDSACVFLGVISNILSATGTGKDTGLSIVRSVRILKIVRIFSRLVALHRLISSINATLGPLFYTFLIYVVTNSIYAVLATQFFSHIDVRQFGSFSKAYLTMVQVSTGDGWATDVLRPLLEEGRESSVHFEWMTALFFVVYMLMVHIVLLNVAVAVLLEGFLTALTDFDGKDDIAEEQEDYKQLSKSLDPIISSFASFHSEEHLGYMITRMFEYLDVDASGSITFEEMKMGIEKLDMQPKLKMTREDFDEFTRDRKYVDDDGCISREGFDECMRQELKGYAFRIATHQMNQALKNDSPSSNDYMCNKILMREMFDMSERLLEIEAPAGINTFSRAGSSRAGSDYISPLPTDVFQARDQGDRSCGCKQKSCFRSVEKEVLAIHSKLDAQQAEISRILQLLQAGIGAQEGGRVKENEAPHPVTPNLRISVADDPAGVRRSPTDGYGLTEDNGTVLSARESGAVRKSPATGPEDTRTRALATRTAAQEQAVLSVLLVSAENLPRPKDPGRKMHPFVMLSLGRQKHQSRVMMNSHYPSWNQSFKFHCSPDVKDPLVLTLGNWDEEGRHRVVGHVQLSPSQFVGKNRSRTPHCLVHRDVLVLSENIRRSTITLEVECLTSGCAGSDNPPSASSTPKPRVISLGVSEGERRDEDHDQISIEKKRRSFSSHLSSSLPTLSSHQLIETPESIISIESDLVYDGAMPAHESHGVSERQSVDDTRGEHHHLAQNSRSANTTQPSHPLAQRRASSLREHRPHDYDSNDFREHRRASFAKEENANDNGHRRASFVEDDATNDHDSNRLRAIQPRPQFNRGGNRSSPDSRSPVRSRPQSRSPVNLRENEGQDELILLRGRHMSRQDKAQSWLQ